MYLEYFGLKEAPFSIAPDPRYLYMSERHREALAHLMYGIRSDGAFVLLTGEVGAGKTTVCRCLLEQLPESCATAFVLNPKVTTGELLATICDELAISYPAGNQSNKVFIDRINAYLLKKHAAGCQTVVIIDEAQNLSLDVLEQLRLLTNLETNRRKLLQIILLGQPEFQDTLKQPELRQLAQRITARYHLGSLSRPEMVAYIHHRLQIAGLSRGGRDLFPPPVMRRLYRLSGGIPRLINLLCDRALLGAYARDQNRITPALLSQAAGEVFGDGADGPLKHWFWALSGVTLILAAVAFAGGYFLPVDFSLRPFIGGDEPPVVRGKIEAVRGNIAVEDPAPIAATIPEDPLAWPEEVPLWRSERLAFEALLIRWGITEFPEGSDDMCRLAAAHGLKCLRDRGNLQTLEILDRPAVLTLRNDAGTSFYATLAGISDGVAELVLGGIARKVPTAAIAGHWQGDFLLMWRRPPEYRGNLTPGERDPFVYWLHRRLALIEGRAPQPRATMEYDEVLVQQVRRFQLSRGLKPDGIVGSKTLIQLNSATGGNEPRLKKGEA